jgi:putative hydrolase of the HAD superfamily
MLRPIRNIVFDLGGVILENDIRLTLDAFASLGSADVGRYFGLGFADSFFLDYELGQISDEEFIGNLRNLIPAPVDDAAIIRAWDALLLDFPPRRIGLLEELGKKFRIFLFSNTNALHLQAVRGIYRKQFGRGTLDEHFEKTYYSHILGMRKPEAAAYLYILQENGLMANETLLVEDSQVNIDGARLVGMEGLLVGPGNPITEVNWENPAD